MEKFQEHRVGLGAWKSCGSRQGLIRDYSEVRVCI